MVLADLLLVVLLPLDTGGMSDDAAGIEAVARWLCLASEYHAQNWRLYLPKARDVIDTYTKAMASAESVD